MKVAKIRLLVATLLLVAWLSWLGYLAWTKTDPVVLSRSQIMASTHFVVAEVTVDETTGLPNQEVTIRTDLRAIAGENLGTIKVRNIREARVGGKPDNFKEPGLFLLMLTHRDGVFELTQPPRSPGDDSLIRPKPWVYRWDAPGVQEQFDSLVPKRQGG